MSKKLQEVSNHTKTHTDPPQTQTHLANCLEKEKAVSKKLQVVSNYTVPKMQEVSNHIVPKKLELL